MSEKIRKNYNIGLDIGTASVGWAVTDDNNFNLLKIKGKNMWGVRLFDGAETAQDRRLSRSTRRRYNKRRERIRLLRFLMNDMIMKVDDSFFIRMENMSFLDKEDKLLESHKRNITYKDNYNLFVDQSFNDKAYYRDFPTIYHLRKHLCENNEKADPRLIYLALHHIVKYRGNFLYEGQSFSFDNSDIKEKINDFFMDFFEKNELKCVIDERQIESMIEVLKQRKVKSQKAKELLDLFSFDKEYKSIFVQIMAAVVGNSFNVSKMFPNDFIQSEGKDIKLKFSEAKFDDDIVKYENDIGDKIESIQELKTIYSWVELHSIIGETNDDRISISNSMIQRYEEHKNDLKSLKDVIRKYYPQKYGEVFKDKKEKLHNYYNYIHHPKDTPIESFYTYIKKILDNTDSEEVKDILDKIDLETFMLKQNNRTNGSIPYQLNKDEMEKIIDNQSQYYPELQENKEKIMSILTFKIPYYYGPLNPNGKDFAWIKKQQGKENERILPWNHEQIVDIDATAEAFIQRMTNFCTYFPEEPVLPKYSLIVSKYEVLAELNKISIDGKLISVDLKNRAYSQLFMKKKKVTDKILRKWLKDNMEVLNVDNTDIRGYQKEDSFSTSLTSWIDFTNIFGEINESNFDLIENIIYDMTVFEDKNILEKRLKNKYNLMPKEIKKILTLNYKGWSRLSKKLLVGIKSDYKGNIGVNVIDVMEMSNMALMEIINHKQLSFKKQIEDVNYIETEGKFHLEEVKMLAGSPALKKGIWQSLLLVDEIKKIMKQEPQNVFIEFSREDGKKERTTTSIKRLQSIYQDIDLQTKEEHEIYRLLNKEDNSKKIDSERLYLYYMQMGKCMYSGNPLDIDKLELYQIDHIVPQSLIKDDSIDNKVLVISKENQRKLDDLVVPKDIREKNFIFWKKLFDSKLISAKKFYSLTKAEYTMRDQERFINRQLVETRQITKHVAQIINNHYKDTKVVTIKANLSHDFRMKYKIFKNRNVNDYHHAHDAYIACVLGKYIQQRFSSLDSKYIYGEFKKYAKNKVNLTYNDGFILNSMNNIFYDETTGEVIWNPDHIGTIKKCFYYKDCFITKKLEEKTGTLFNLTIQPNDKNSTKKRTKDLIPVNKFRADFHKYGGFDGIQSVALAIKGIEKRKNKDIHINRVVALPLVYVDWSKLKKENYIKKEHKLENVEIIKVIKKNQLIEIDGGLYYLTSASEFVNAKQLILNEKDYNLVHMINVSVNKNDYKDLNNQRIDELYITLYKKIEDYYPMYKTIAKHFSDEIEQFKRFSIDIKCNIIQQILKVLQANPSNGSISIEGFYKNDRIGRLSKKTVELDKTYFISQSVTGIYSKKYKL